MLDKIIRYSISNKLMVGLLTLALVAWGIYSLTHLPIDAVPDITNNQVQILTVAPSQSAIDIERQVTFPVEQTMTTIAGIQEVRSFSRFGLSVVTIVFNDNVDIYWARQQVSERLAMAARELAPGAGVPELAPVTTGLGEIYQYIIRPKKGYEQKYTAMELRSVQDWIVRRQLLGTKGVADVASFGGYLKQYEIAIDPDKLRSYNLGVVEVFDALEANNQNTGGAYIEKKPNAYFIRSEGIVTTADDIGEIAISLTQSGMPVLIRDVATVDLGYANRFGAMTYNADGEVVGAIVMMLKGENSNAVVNRVKERMSQIEKTLPEGLTIEAFLDRSELVGRTIGTVERNLIEGALIVIVVLVLFLGNLRAGLIVASVIPLAMLFAVSLMHVFGVSGNLMSLGAIDFGLIVDGAVIIVEATMHHLGVRSITRRLTQTEMDEEVFVSASRIRASAAFGEIIILIVYLPILALVGVEGKMFRPMAQTVAFAILGAFILSLTYVPMMSALFLSKHAHRQPNFSDRMMAFFHRLYRPILQGALRHRAITILAAVVLFAVSLGLFARMGGEFLPTLDEGDFAVETRVLTGSSLSYTVNAAQAAAAVLLREFPDEVAEVAGKIGSSEIPTDPMPMEACDLIVILKPRGQWTKATHRDDLAEKMKEALTAIPGVTFGFQQPIQMRFNELMTGVRQDVAVKIFGEDLEVLTGLSQQVAGVVASVEGTRDLYTEEVTGLPQIVVKINRNELAKYGVSVAAVNHVIHTAFAGESAGYVYEGEKRFDLVVRLRPESRQRIEDVQHLFITSPAGNHIPLSQLADVSLEVGPNQIQREDAKRRIIVGFNVRGRDVTSVVGELQQKIGGQVKFPPGYYATYGGQFENLREAQARLALAVPAALALIFVLLYLTFASMRQALLIFTAIPMAAAGGVFALLLRGMPFSISAGIGFIALFGVAVFNGIVLIAEFNRLKKEEGLTDLDAIIEKGTAIRLRPVLMTAAVASLGFLPMALATSAGAEVQKPLATVVIGGLISATLLTLVVIPCLYKYVEDFYTKKINANRPLILGVMVVLVSWARPARGQMALTEDEAVAIALQKNRSMVAADLSIDYQQQRARAVKEISKTSLTYIRGQYNSYASDDNNITVSQSMPFPTVFGAQRRLGSALVKEQELQKNVAAWELAWQVRRVYRTLQYLHARETLQRRQDSIFTRFVSAARLRFTTGESTLLEKITAEAQQSEAHIVWQQTLADIDIHLSQLQTLLNTELPVQIERGALRAHAFETTPDSIAVPHSPQLVLLEQQITVATGEKSVARARMLPDLHAGFFNQTLIGTPRDDSGQPATRSDRFYGFQVGLSLPIWFGPQAAQIKAADASRKKAEVLAAHGKAQLSSQWHQARQAYLKAKRSVTYYESAAAPQAELMVTQADIAFRSGEIDYNAYWMAVRSALQIQDAYLEQLNDLNQSALYLAYLAGPGK